MGRASRPILAERLTMVAGPAQLGMRDLLALIFIAGAILAVVLVEEAILRFRQRFGRARID